MVMVIEMVMVMVVVMAGGSNTRYGEDVEDGGDGDVDGSGDGYVENHDHDDWAAWVNGGGNDFTIVDCRQTSKILKGESFLQQGLSGSMWSNCTQPDSRLQAGRGMMIPLRNIAPKVNQPFLPNHADIMTSCRPHYIQLHQTYLN